ncbi:hypothetical protein [Kitasatospora sp. NPDC001547]|uniref:hypothetical protein n=1 Tax=Kitasatospora sp. NPDC001547 TaxID=3364015 RepID=UPI0036CC98EE
MATPPAPPAPTTPPTVHLPSQPPEQPSAEAPQTGPGPAPAAPAGPGPDPAAPGSLAQMLTPIAPARPVPIGSTATLGHASQAGPEGAAAGGDAKGKGGKDDTTTGEGPLSALVRALAARWGRTGTATTIKRGHEVKETRVSGTSTNTTNSNKSDRTAKSENTSQRRSNQDAKSSRDAKVADLNNKTSAQHGKTSSESKKADNRDAKTSSDAKRADTRDAKTSAAKDAKTSDTTSDTKAAKADTSSKTAKDDRTSADTKTAKSSDSKASKASGGSAGSGRAGDSGSGSGGSKSGKGLGREGKDEAKSSSGSPKTSVTEGPGAKRTKGPKPDGTDGSAGAGVPVVKPDGPGQAGAQAGKQSKKEDKQGKADLVKKEQAGPGANITAAKAVGEQERAERPRTQSAREAGYRDGRRVAGAVGQAQAYRDGVKDGWSDQQAADEAERKKMDEAKVRNAQRPKEPPKPEMAPTAGSTTDLAEKDQAAKVSAAPEQGGKAAPVVPPKPPAPPTVPAQSKAEATLKPGDRPGIDLTKKAKPGEEGKAAPVVPPKPTTPPIVPAQSKAEAPKAGDRPGVDLTKPAKPGEKAKTAPSTPTTPAPPETDPAQQPNSDDDPDTGAAKRPTGPQRPPGRPDGKTVDHGPFKLGPVASTTALAQTAPPPDQAAAHALTDAVRPAPNTPPDGPATPRRSHETMPATSTTNGATPASKIKVTPSTVRFTADGEERELGRTEIRTLKGFENTLRKRGADLAKIAEESKSAVTVATQHALAAQRLHERAKAVKGGESLIWQLEALADHCRELCKAAEQTERHATNGAEAAAALVVNADTRHGAIYQAVVDSKLTIPAEKEFYKDQQGG